ncbi:DUF3159 domain-containing protein [Streptomyces diastatochromogenes]|uniref:hypothetical protein n=1 Tax=Streptomyces diastatochromogenes TaxID=42236 RepID=UPI003699E6F0
MAQQSATRDRTAAPVGFGSVFLSFAPWIVFTVIAGPSTWEYAALAALVTALVLSGQDILHGRLSILDVTGIVFFAVICVLALALGRQQLLWLETYAQVIANGVIAVVALGSLFFQPFTEQYARRSAPPEVWDSPLFKRINRVLTAVWGAVFAVITVLGWLAIRIPSASDWLNWVLPVALLVWAVNFTRRYPESQRGRALPS